MTRLPKLLSQEPEWFSAPLRRWIDQLWKSDRFFDDESVRDEFMPAVNIKETNATFEIEVAAPGMKKKDFEVSIENGRLHISADHQEESQEKKADYTRREFAFQSMRRSFLLPENVDQKHVEARYDNGILYLTLTKTKETPVEVKKIAVQ